MANSTSFIYFDDAKVIRRKKTYKIILEDADATIFLKEEVINFTATQIEEDENLTAILLAYIDYVRRSSYKNNREPSKIKDEVVADGLKELLTGGISIEILIVKIKSMKWHEIKKVLTSESPLAEIDEL